MNAGHWDGASTHVYAMDNAIQRHLETAVSIPGVLAALVCLDGKEFRFRTPSTHEDVTKAVDVLTGQLRSKGRSASLGQHVSIGGTDAILVAAFSGRSDVAPFIIGAVKASGPDEAAGVTEHLQRILHACVGESYSTRYK